MTYEGTVEETPVIVPEETYNACPARITKMDSKHGPCLRIYFKIDSEDVFDGKEVTGMCSDQIHGNTKWGNWIKAITGKLPMPGEKINEERDILLKPCQIKVTHTRKDENIVFANVKNVLPPQQKSTNNGGTPF